jgi:quinoprotein glucose dehydrogenase
LFRSFSSCLSLGVSYPNAERGLRDGLITRRQYDQIVEAIRRRVAPPQHTPLGGASIPTKLVQIVNWKRERGNRGVKTRNSRNATAGSVLSVSLLLVCQSLSLAQTDWPNVGNDKGAMRYSTLSQINRQNVGKLKAAWTFRTGGLHSGIQNAAIQCTPIVVDGVMYLTSPDTQAIALDAATGRELWRFDPKRGWRHRYLHNRGVAFWKDARRGGASRILLATPDGFLHSLDARTGKPDARFGSAGVVDLRRGIERDLRHLVYGVTAAPSIFEDLVILGFSLDEGYEGGPGDIRAFDVRTGKEVWRFRTVPRPGEFGHETWRGESWRDRGGVNAWSGSTLDVGRGLVFVGLGSAGFDFYGGDRQGDNLFANSVLALDARTGRRVWHYQLIHHDIWDYDLPYPPVLATVRHDGRLIDAVAQVTKQGFVFLFDRVRGKPLFEIVERPTPQSDVPGEQTSATQPFPVKPPAFARQGFTVEDITDISREARESVRAKLGDARFGPLFTPPSLQGTVYSPGTIGGASWAGAAFDPATGSLFVNANNFPRVLKLAPTSTRAEPFHDVGLLRLTDHEGYPGVKPPWGTLTRIDLNEGKIQWQITLGEFPELTARGVPPTGTPNLGGCIVTAGGLVFIGATMDEKFRAFDSATGEMMWEHKLPFGGYATPSTYSVNGRQFVVIAAGGGGKLGTKSGDAYVAFALP